MIIYHLVPKRYFERQDPRADYFPASFEKDQFIHCTKDAAEMARIGNRFYQDERGPHVYLYIDSRKVRAKIKYQDPERKYPHIHGGLNRDAIIATRPARKDAKGRFLPPEAL